MTAALTGSLPAQPTPPQKRIILPAGANRNGKGSWGKRKQRLQNSGRRPLSRVLLALAGRTRLGPAAIPLGRESPHGSSHLPASIGRAGRSVGVRTPRATLAYLVLLRMEVAAFHPSAYCEPRTRLCGPLRHVAVPGSYPASRSAEPGLSSARLMFRRAAAAWPTPAASLSRLNGLKFKPPKVARVVVQLHALAPGKPSRIPEDRQRGQLARRRLGGKRAGPRR